MKRIFFVLAFIFATVLANAQQPWPQRMAATAMKLWPDTSAQWSCEHCMALNGVESVWEQTADNQYFSYVQHSMDALIAHDGTIKNFQKNDQTLDNAMFGRLALKLFNITEQKKYYKAALQLYGQLKTGRLGQKYNKTNPKRHDDLYVVEPFYADWAHTFHQDSDFNDIAKQFILIKGLSPRNSSYSYGLYLMTFVDVLDNFPKSNANYKKLIAVLSRLSTNIQKHQDVKTGLWRSMLTKSNQRVNHFDTTASCMFVYAFAKSVRKGYLPANYINVARKGYKAMLHKFTEVHTNGAFIQASVEMERLDNLSLGKSKTVLVDSYFNNEHRKDITGKTISYHYKWDEMTNNGFSFLGTVFNNYGVKTGTLYDAPTAENLKSANIYIIVDPDIPKENPDTKYIEAAHIKAISDWVRAGGVLAVLNNDTGNAEFAHLNKLLLKFGIRFNLDSRNNVKGIQYEQGAIYIPAGNEIFKTAKKIYMKDISTLHVDAPAHSALTDKNDVIVAIAKYGKGTIFAVGDPWFYNEYTDGRKLSPDFQNFTAANDFVKWLIGQIPK